MTTSVESVERTISHDEAQAALQAFIDNWFRKDSEHKVRIGIPASPDDTDVLLSRYIEQQRAATSERSRVIRELAEKAEREANEAAKGPFGIMSTDVQVPRMVAAWLRSQEGK